MTEPVSSSQPMSGEEQSHETIWLQPWCNGCDKNSWGGHDGRQWCQDNVWTNCDECKRKPVCYIRADSHASLKARNEELEAALRECISQLVPFGEDGDQPAITAAIKNGRCVLQSKGGK